MKLHAKLEVAVRQLPQLQKQYSEKSYFFMLPIEKFLFYFIFKFFFVKIPNR